MKMVKVIIPQEVVLERWKLITICQLSSQWPLFTGPLNICSDDKRTNTTVVFCRWRYKITTVVWRCLSCANEFSSRQMSKSMECQQGQKTSATKQKHNTTVFCVWVFGVGGAFCVLGFCVLSLSFCPKIAFSVLTAPACRWISTTSYNLRKISNG